MGTSIFLARLIGPIALLAGLALVFNRTAYQAVMEEFLRGHALIVLSGVMTLAAGLAIVLTHNVWSADWRVVITILGWLFIISGIVRMALPQHAAALGRRVHASSTALCIAGAFDIAIGVLLCIFGYNR
jgi:uncharacterized membrane protein HdeD (DUF308 family)